MTTPDHYSVLGVSVDADRETIRRAYVAIARATHPDRASGDSVARASASRRIREANAAWNVLGDENRRREYDRRRSGAQSPPTRSAPAAPRTRVVADHARRSGPVEPPPTSASKGAWIGVFALLVLVLVILVVSAYATANDGGSAATTTTSIAPKVGSCVAVTASDSGRVATVVPCSGMVSGRVAAIVESPRPCPTGVAIELADGRTTLCLTADG